MPRRLLIPLVLVLLGAIIAATVLWPRGGVAVPPPPVLPADATVDPEVRSLIDGLRSRAAASPGNAGLRGQLGMALHANGLNALAEEAYGQAIALDGADPRWWYHRARLRIRRGAEDAAFADVAEAARLAPTAAPPFWRRGLWRLDADRLDEAEADFRYVLRLDADQPAALAGLGRLQLMRDQPAAAAQTLERVLRTSPDAPFTPYVHGLLALAHRDAGDIGQARVHFARSGDTPPAWPDPWSDEVAAQRRGYGATIERAQALILAGRPEEAIPLLTAHLDRFENDPVGLNALNAAYVGAGRTDEAAALLQRAIDRNPDDAVSRVNLAQLQRQGGNLDGAAANARRAIEINPAFGNAHLELGRILIEQRDLAGAATALDTAFSHGAGSDADRLMFGRVNLALRRWGRAIDLFQTNLQHDPNDVSAWCGLAVALAEAAPVEQARGAVQRAAGLNPAGPDLDLLERARRRLQERSGG